jgi:AbrB family looped-hinge helix DNA binding protein
MKLQSENTSRKVDSLGRVSIPKSLRDRLMINTEDQVYFYLLEDDDGR